MLNEGTVTEGMLPEGQQQRLRAAFGVLARRQSEWCRSVGLDQYRVSKMINGRQPVTTAYVGPFNDLLNEAQDALKRPRAAAA